MTKNTTKAKLRDGRSVIGTFVYLSDPAVVEIAGRAGLDFVIVDTEHIARDASQLENLIRAAELVGITPLVRVPTNAENEILRALEAGAQGIVAPFVQSAADVRQIQSAMLYPPQGTRGSCTYTRATEWGTGHSTFEQHTQAANEDLLLVGLIENIKGVRNIDEIFDAALDVAFLGRRDLAVSLGLGDVSDASVIAAVREVLAAAERRQGDSAVGIVGYDRAELGSWRQQGCRFLCYSLDVAVLLAAYRDAAEECPKTEEVSVPSVGLTEVDA